MNRTVMLQERLASSKHAAVSDGIMSIVRGQTPLIHGMAVEVERASGKTAPNGEVYHVKIKASTDGIARDSGVIPISAWEKGGLRNFNENPIILAYHSHRDPIGRSVYTELDAENLVEYWLFHEEDDLSRKMKTLYEKGFMRAASVGFLVKEWAFVDELDDKELSALETKYGKSAVKDIYWIARKAELLETSAVPVPSDPKALAFSFAARNAGAHGLDVTDLLSRWTPTTDRTNSMNKTPEQEKAERDAAAAALVTAEAARLAAAVTPDPIAELRTLVEAGLTELRTANTALVARLAAVETRDAAVVVPPVKEAREGAEGQTAIEVNDGETAQQAIDRHVSAAIAKLRGAPVPKQK